MIGNLVYSMRDKLKSILRSNICSEETCLLRSEMDEVICDLCAKRKQKEYLKMRRVKNRKTIIAKKENSKSSIRPFLRSFISFLIIYYTVFLVCNICLAFVYVRHNNKEPVFTAGNT